MVKHVLFVKMKDPSREECEKVKALFLSMKEQIDFIRDLQDRKSTRLNSSH